jgi:hypothetical protein
LRNTPVRVLAYDLLERDGEDLRGLPLQQRRAQLAEVIGALGDARIQLSPDVAAGRLAAGRRDARCRTRTRRGRVDAETPDVRLPAGRRRDWWKWKVDPLTIDAVLLYAQAGHGRRSTLYTDYTFGVWDGDTLVPVAKAYSGLDDKEILALDRWIRANTRERFGPVRSVRAEQVFELGFEAVNRSSRHKSGIAVRFPASCAGATTSPPARPISWPRCRRWRDEPQPGAAPAGRLVRGARLALAAVPARDVAALSGRRSGLLHTPTGSGKTLAMFGGPLLQAMIDPPPAPRRASAVRPLQVLWVTPLRALASDTARALQAVVDGLGLGWRVGLRSGDASNRERRQAREGRVDVLVTTPESLALLLSYPDTLPRMRQLRCVVVDEWHELLGNKRGVLLQLNLAVLRDAAPSLQLWGLSATLGNLPQARDVLLPGPAGRTDRAGRSPARDQRAQPAAGTR